MFYFIPAWYNPWRDWYDNTEPFYRPAMHGFDDTISQLRMFEKSGQETRVLLFSYMPNLRRFLHQYDLLEGKVWSLFDEIQTISNQAYRLTDFKDLNWPEGSEFIYTPFLVIVRHQGHELAKIEFGQEGQLIWIDFKTEGQLSYKYIFDDRGFVSSIIYYRDGQEYHQDYLNAQGEWQIREYRLPDDYHVEINPKQQFRFKKSRYGSLEELIVERFSDFLLNNLMKKDTIILAAHRLNLPVYQLFNQSVRVVTSFYGNRFDLSHEEGFKKIVETSDLLIADSLWLTKELQEKQSQKVEHISPFDTRLTLGQSQRLKELIVHFVLDGLDRSHIKDHLMTVFKAMEDNENIYLSLVTYNHDHYQREDLNQFILALLEEQEKDYLFIEDDESSIPQDILEEDIVESRVSFAFLGSEIDILNQLNKARLVVDLSAKPHLYTQIAAISAGIPQVNQMNTEFVEHLKNGFILQDKTDLMTALEYYLNGLRNWNQALVYAVQKITDYTSGKLVRRIVDNIE